MRSDNLFKPSCAVRKLIQIFKRIEKGDLDISYGDEIRFKLVDDDDYKIYIKTGGE